MPDDPYSGPQTYAYVGSFDSNVFVGYGQFYGGSELGLTYQVNTTSEVGSTITVDQYENGFFQTFFSGTVLASGPIGVVGLMNTEEGTYTLEFTNLEQPNAGSFDYNTDLPAPCYVQGTLIRTDEGEKPIEALRIGDRVEMLGGAHLPVVWIGQRTLHFAHRRDGNAALPVRISAGAFDIGQPARDLHVSPDHAIYFEGRLIPAKALINGMTVRQMKVSSVTYLHVQLSRHAVIFAEGLAAESYLDSGNVCGFSKADAIAGSFPQGRDPDYNYWMWETFGCAPLVLNGPHVERARTHLRNRQAILVLAGFNETDRMEERRTARLRA